MYKWKLVADSSCCLTKEANGNEFSTPFETVPLTIKVDTTEYVDEYGLDVEKMIDHMKEYGKPCSTSCPSVQRFAESFEDAENVLCITISSNLSGSYNSAVQARNMVMEEHPEKHIYILDAKSTAGDMILMLRHADKIISEGKSFDEVCSIMEEHVKQTRIIFSLSCFDNLINAGRMGKITGMIASALKIRPVATNSPRGTIDVMEKPRGEKRAIERMVSLMKDYKDMKDRSVIIVHCRNDEGAGNLKAAILEAYPEVKSVEIIKGTGLVAYYSDVGSLLLSF